MALNRSPELVKFVAAAKEKGASDETLIGILKNAGWPRG
jgi:alkylhydroperoxidase/carboxymuconolactone decarboxylase family protein YurZ